VTVGGAVVNICILLSCLVSGIAHADDPVLLPLAKSLHLREVPDTNPTGFIGRFFENGVPVTSELEAIALGCSAEIAWERVEVPSVVHEELVEVEKAMALRLGFDAVSLGVGAEKKDLALVRYTLTGRLVARYDAESLTSCCEQRPTECRGRFVGEYLEARDGVIQAASTVGGSVDASAIIEAVPVSIKAKGSKQSSSSVTFESPTYFAFREHYTRRGSEQRAQVAREVELQDGIAAVVQHIPRRDSRRDLFVDSPRWSDGCIAKPGGSLIYNMTMSSLASATSRRSFSLLDQADPEAYTLRTTLSRGPTDVFIHMDLKRTERGASLPLGGYRVSSSFAGMDLEESSSCQTDSALGLSLGERTGDGPQVVVSMPIGDGQLCEGEPVSASVFVDAPARVRVFSVTAEGRGFLIWPPPGGSDRITREASLGQMHPVIHPELSEPRLLAVAIPGESSWGEMERWNALCRVPGDFGDEFYPSGSGVHAISYTVIPDDDSRCGSGSSVDPVPLLNVLDSAPICGR